MLEVIDPDAAEELEARRLRQEEDAAAAKTWLTTWDDRDGTTHLNVKLSTRHADMLRTVLHAIANPSLADAITRTSIAVDADGVATRTERPGQRVMGEAFCRLIETLDPNRLPHSGGLSATVVVTIPLETLQGGLGAATMDTGTRLSPGEARRMACDAGLIPVVLGGKSEVLDYGRLRRLYSKPQRVAMAIRQSFRCAAEGCDGPPRCATPTTSNPGPATAARPRRRRPPLRTPPHPGPPPRLHRRTTTRLAHQHHPHPTHHTPTPIGDTLPLPRRPAADPHRAGCVSRAPWLRRGGPGTASATTSASS